MMKFIQSNSDFLRKKKSGTSLASKMDLCHIKFHFKMALLSNFFVFDAKKWFITVNIIEYQLN